MDVHIEFRLASKWQAAELFKCFYPATHDADPDPLIDLTVDFADSDSASEASVADGADTPLIPDTPATSIDTHSTTDLLLGAKNFSLQTAKISRQKLARLAAKFADIVPDREFSMAALQGHLMRYKTRPEEAVADAAAWITRERAIRAERARAQAVPKAAVPAPVVPAVKA